MLSCLFFQCPDCITTAQPTNSWVGGLFAASRNKGENVMSLRFEGCGLTKEPSNLLPQGWLSWIPFLSSQGSWMQD
jgi:hypothetical protein